MKEATMRRFLTVLSVLLGVFASTRATAQEIQLTGPLAGAPAVRQLRLQRQGRVEIAPTISFTILDEYQRTILPGGRITYNIADWIAIGIWGAYGAVHVPTSLSDHIQEVSVARRINEPNDYPGNISINNLLTRSSISPTDFREQLGEINYVVSPQVTLIPFRGKLAIFQKIFVDTDAYLFGGAAIVGVTERASCETDCDVQWGRAARTTVAPTFGLGFNFYLAKFIALGLEWRGMPFAWNTGGFDNRGADPDGNFPDNKINEEDRQMKFNQMLSVNLGFYVPAKPKTSD
jgi:outer membrane beta-barrel protein